MSIFLYVVRHGEAEPVFKEDKERALTAVGRVEAEKAAKWLHSMVPMFDFAVVSPYKRAQQTHDIILDSVTTVESHTTDLIIPSGIPELAVDELLARAQLNNKKNQHILCVSHMPLVSYLVGELTGKTPVFATAAVAVIELDIERWSGQLMQLMSPENMSS